MKILTLGVDTKDYEKLYSKVQGLAKKLKKKLDFKLYE